MTDLFLGVPFAGYESPYLERWMAAYAAMADGLEAEGLWLYNGREESFAYDLCRYAEAMPIAVEVMWETLPVLGNTDAIRKNNAVAMAHARLHHELRKRCPEAGIFLQESDVIVPAGGVQRLQDGLARHTGIVALSAAVPDPRRFSPPAVGTMVWRLKPKPPGAYTVPLDGAPVAPYDTEMCDGIEVVDALPLGALLTSLPVFEKVPLATKLFPGLGVDQEWSLNALYEGGLNIAVDWGVRCGHLKNIFNPEYDDLRERVTTEAPREVGLA